MAKAAVQDAPVETTEDAGVPTPADLGVEVADPAEADKALGDLMASHEDDPADEDEGGTDAAPSSARDKNGKFKKTDESTDDSVAARSALERDGWDSTDIDKLDDERVLALGQKAAKRQSDIDGKIEQHTKTAQQLADLRNGLGKITDSGTQNAEDQPDDPFKAVSQHVEQFYADKDLGTLLRQPHDVLAQRVARVEADITSVLDEVLRDKVMKDYPELKGDEEFARVSKRMQQLGVTGEYQNRAALMRDSAKVEFADERQAKAAKVQKQTRAARDTSTQAPPGQDTPTPTTIDDMSYEDLTDSLLDATMAQDVKLQDRIKAKMAKLRL